MTICRDCGDPIAQEGEKALDGTYAVVWTSQEGWICPITREEHEPA